nr:protein ECERIFERUM 1-like [Ipomoea batatas]
MKCLFQSRGTKQERRGFTSQKYPEMKMRLVDGVALAAAIVHMNTSSQRVPTEVLLRANPYTTVSISIASALTQRGINAVIHPFGEILAYFLLFAIPTLTTITTGTASNISLIGYFTYIDAMNNLGHCNFEFFPKCLFSIFPPLKYLMYTPSFHSLHHTQFRTNYSLFMPFYDYIYGTMDKSSDTLYEVSLEKEEEFPDVVHLTHLITPESVYYLRLGFSSWASVPQNQKWYIWLMWPLTIIINSISNQTFILERNILGKYLLKRRQSRGINGLIEEAILDAEAKGVKSEELNRNGEVYVQKYPKIKMRLVDGSSLAAAIVMNTIPKGTTEVLLRANLNKVSISIASALTQRGIKVVTSCEDDYEKLKLVTNSKDNLVLSRNFTQKNWLPRKAMSAARLAGILHALEGWNVHECGETMLDTDKVWEAAVRHGFRLMMLDFEWLRSFN